MSEEKFTCSKRGLNFIPSPIFDFYPEPTAENPDAGLCETCMITGVFAESAAPKIDPVPVPKECVERVCKRGQGKATCSFLGFDAKTGNFSCLKGSSFEAPIRERLRNGSIRAKGDNCSGPPDFALKN